MTHYIILFLLFLMDLSDQEGVGCVGSDLFSPIILSLLLNQTSPHHTSKRLFDFILEM